MYAFFKALLLPPASILLLVLVGAFLARRWRGGRILVAAALVFMWVLSTPVVAVWLLGTLETAPVGVRDPAVQAIVILSGDTLQDRELGEWTVGSYALERLRLGARLHRETGLPILVTGGTDGQGKAKTAARAMKHTLVTDFKVPVRWVENRSRTTAENAFFAAEILLPQGISHIYLVSQAWHLPRARDVFAEAGFEVISVGAGNREERRVEPKHFVPAAGAFRDSTIAVHEWLGRVWYRIRHSA